ncbi:MAG: ferredoxin [Myxococcota bacterium]
MSYTVRIDKQSCLSSGRCIAAAPEALAWDEDQLADARPAAGSLSRERLIAIARGCPSLSITVLDEDRNEIAP